MPPARRDADLAWPAEPDPVLIDLEPGDPADVVPHGRLDGVLLDGLRGRLDAADTAILECRLVDVRLDAADLTNARLRCTLLEGLAAPVVDAGGSTWVEVVGRDLRVGALDLHGADLARVSLRGRFDYVTARGATLANVDLSECRIGELDLTGAHVKAVRLRDADLGRLVLDGAHLDRLDLRGASLEALDGVANLSGAVIDDPLLTQLAPALAAQLGVRVVP